MTAVSVDELQRAWSAVAAGQFRAAPGGPRHPVTSQRWNSLEPVIAVVGASGRVGASTVALAIATTAETPSRVVECCSMQLTGLASATTAELGVDDAGWRRGNRGPVLIERTSASIDDPGQVPVPSPTPSVLTIVDIGWDLAQVRRTNTWLSPVLDEAPLVLVTVATVPGMRALDTALRTAGHADAAWFAVVGPAYKKWPRSVRLACTPAIDAAHSRGSLLAIPTIKSIAIDGITAQALPDALVSACRPILDQMVEHSRGNDHAVHL